MRSGQASVLYALLFVLAPGGLRAQPSEKEATALLNEGADLHRKHDYRGAQERWTRSLDAFRRLGFEEPQARVLAQLANVAEELGEQKEAGDYFTEALALYRKLKQDAPAAEALRGLGDVAIARGEYGRARAHYEEALATARKLGLEQERADLLPGLGSAALGLGEYDRARGYFEQALDAYQKQGRANLATAVLNGLGTVAYDLGQYNEARRRYDQALALGRKQSQDKEVARVLNNLGNVARALGEDNKAIELYEQALAMYRKTGLPVREPGCSLVYVEWKRVYARGIDKEQAAFIRGGDALQEVMRAQQGCGSFVGLVHLMSRQLSEAREEFRETVIGARLAKDANTLFAGLTGFALSQERLGEMGSAADYFEEAVELLEEQRTSLSHAERLHFLSGELLGFRRLEAYEGLVRVLHRQGNPQEAFYWSEHTRARGLIEAVARSASSANLGIPASVRQKDQDLANRIASVQRQIQGARENNNQGLQFRLRDDLDQLKQEQKTLVTELTRAYPEYAAMQYPQPLQANELALGADEVLLAYQVTDPLTLVFVVRGGKVEKTVEVKISRQELADEVDRYRAALVETGRTGSASTLAKLDLELGRRLWQQLLEEPLAGVRPGEKVLLVPDNVLCALPFEALVERLPEGRVTWGTGAHGPFPKGVRYAGDSRVFSYWQSASALTMLRRLGRNVGGDGVLVVADPVFNLQDSRLSKERVMLARKSLESEPLRVMGREITEAVSRSIGVEEFGRLPGTAGLLERLRIPYGERLKALVGLEANKTAVRGERMERYGAGVIFATHGIVDERVPYLQQAALVLSNPALTGESPEASDGFLTMSDVMDLKMPTELVAALACETGLGSDVRGEGVMHLGRAFQYAGARSALMSLWSVEDESTNELGARVLAGMEKGEGKDAALLAARKLLREKGYEHPFFWAGFILVGERDVRQNRQTEQK